MRSMSWNLSKPRRKLSRNFKTQLTSIWTIDFRHSPSLHLMRCTRQGNTRPPHKENRNHVSADPHIENHHRGGLHHEGGGASKSVHRLGGRTSGIAASAPFDLALPRRSASASADSSSGRTFAPSRTFCLPRADSTNRVSASLNRFPASGSPSPRLVFELVVMVDTSV